MINPIPNSCCHAQEVSPSILDADQGITRNSQWAYVYVVSLFLNWFQLVHRRCRQSCALSDQPASNDITVWANGGSQLNHSHTQNRVSRLVLLLKLSNSNQSFTAKYVQKQCLPPPVWLMKETGMCTQKRLLHLKQQASSSTRAATCCGPVYISMTPIEQ